MYSRKGLAANNDCCDSGGKKKYELSLKRGKNTIPPNNTRNMHETEKPMTMKNHVDSENSLDSQNFMLRLSDSFLADDTQENRDPRNAPSMENSDENEVILISDSSEDETPLRYEWMKVKTSGSMRDMETKNSSNSGIICHVLSSDSENDVPRKISPTKISANNLASTRTSKKKCSISYTSDETASDTESGIFENKENFVKIRSRITDNIIPESDESIFTFDKMRGVLTDNENRINVPENSSKFTEFNRPNVEIRGLRNGTINNKILKERNIIDEHRGTPEYAKDDTRNLKCLKETNRRIEDSRKTPEFSKLIQNDTGSLKGTSRRLEDSRRTPEFTKLIQNDTGSLKGTSRRLEDSRRTPEFTKLIQNETGSLKGTSRRIENSRKTPESAKSIQNDTGSLKGTNRRMEDSRNTPEFARIMKKNTGSLTNLGEESEKNEISRRTPGSAKITSRTTVLTNKDVRNILKVIKSKRAVIESPREWKKRPVSDESDNDVDESIVDCQENNVYDKPVVIAETDSDSEDPVIRGSEIDLARPSKTHLTRFLDPTTMSCDSPETMSERKKLEVAHWLMTNSADTRRSESSVSNVSASNRNSASSGNSSLERLEINYETPNNRDKMRNRTTNTDERSTKGQAPNSTKSTKSLRQTTIDNYLSTTNDGKGKIYTPVAPTGKSMRNLTATKKVEENLDIQDCADILDNLYGKTWRSKAEDLLPMSEPRKKNIILRDKGVQTERKVKQNNARGKRATMSSSDEEFDSFVKNIKPNLNSTKKPVPKSDYRQCSFINDSSSSGESRGESTYMTALTHPRISDDLKNRPVPISEHVKRAIAICDSDSEDENNGRADNKKVLSFSDDDDGERSTSTSEYDPNDVIPPKKKTTKTYGASTAPRNVPKITKIIASDVKLPKPRNTFLSSLSASVPLVEAHPDARKYRQNYKDTKEDLCKHLYKTYNENIFDGKLPSDMLIEWNVRMRGTAGFCYNKRSVKALGGVTRSSRIVLATKILDTPDRLRDTLVHEMCHAAAWLINETADGHGPYWRGWVSKAMKAFPELPPIKRCHDYKITTKYTYRCTSCGYSVGRHSKSLDIERKRCGHCYSKFELLINKVTKSGAIEVRTPTTKKPTAFALFVKENYSTVKKERKGVPHKEVMQILGQQFSAIKITKKNDNPDDNCPIVLND